VFKCKPSDFITSPGGHTTRSKSFIVGSGSKLRNSSVSSPDQQFAIE
jgi:hypothetical protein